MKLVTKVLTVITLLIYIIHLVFHALAARADSKLFPNTVSNVSRHFDLEMTPVGATFSIWGVIFTWQVCWLLYCVSTMFRSGPATNILTNRFFILFIANITMITIWLFTWARKEGVISFVVILLGQIFVDLTIGFACYDLKKYLDEQHVQQGKVDIWAQRILVQNGLLFYGTWTTVATLINFAVVLAYYLDISTRIASIISLSFLGILAITWFALENFAFRSFTEYTFSAYIVLVVALTGILANIFDEDKVVGGITLGLLILSGIFLIARVIILIIRHCTKRHVDDNTTAVYTKKGIMA